MATNAGSVPAPAGPVPFKDVENKMDLQVTTVPSEKSPEEHDDAMLLVSALPIKLAAGTKLKLRCYQGFWLPERFVPAAVAMQRSLVPRPDDVVIASLPKCGTTWLNALAFATMARRSYPPAGADHPLLRLNPHECVPFLDALFAEGGGEARLAALPSPRLMYTHMPHAMLPRGLNKVVYICREPKDTAVSLWQFRRSAHPEIPFGDTFDSVCDGGSTYGPFWDHVLGYWRASLECPEQVLFLRYEELLRDPAENVRRLARFVGAPFSEAEEDAGVVRGIVELCSLGSLRNMEVNRTGLMAGLGFPRKALFRKGVAGDWANHMTPEMARRMDEVVADKFRGTGLTFQ
ncbi:cytosolic sulfotransferase 5-like [Lolium rigidum]|uniref:cytosolic sulfotransferase 5-like n=1 Tax=Lolium rigidum TaxID=89674 RepID=UPI001F5D8905|nr:cytosolic sulfotransferase 5-like [Lolium rigidum]